MLLVVKSEQGRTYEKHDEDENEDGSENNTRAARFAGYEEDSNGETKNPFRFSRKGLSIS